MPASVGAPLLNTEVPHMKRRDSFTKWKLAASKKVLLNVLTHLLSHLSDPVCEFAGKFVYYDDVIMGVVASTNEGMPKLSFKLC